MAQRKSIRGPRSSVLWLAIILILVLAIALVSVVFVIGPERQLVVQATAAAQAYISQATATAQAYASEVQRAYEAGVVFATAGDWDKAVEEFTSVVALEPGYKDAAMRLAEARASALESAYQRGLAYFDLERWEQAKAEFERVISSGPNYKDIKAKLAEAETRLAEVRALTPTATSTITPGPSPTPLPTATNTPTTPPTNTPTSVPTVTPTHTPTPAPTATLTAELPESYHPYANNYNHTWTVSRPGASEMRIHFSRVALAYGDSLYLVGKDGRELKRFWGGVHGMLWGFGEKIYRDEKDVWTDWYTGDTLKLRLVTDREDTSYGFAVDRVETR